MKRSTRGRAVAGAVAAALLIAATLSIGEAGAEPPGPVSVPVPDGWTATDDESRFGRETLWEAINGAAELYLGYRFREMVRRDLERDGARYAVSVFDMQDPLDAFGVYRCERPDDAVLLDGVGAAAVLEAPDRGYLWKDRYYLKVRAHDEDVESRVFAAAIRDLAAALPGWSDPPAEFAQLPIHGRVPESLAYWGRGYLGLEDLQGCLYAEYESPSQPEAATFRMFVMRPRPGFWSGASPRWTVEDDASGRRVFFREVPYTGWVVLRGTEELLLGVADLASVEDALAVLDEVAPGE